jgi:hypothetical protein
MTNQSTPVNIEAANIGFNIVIRYLPWLLAADYTIKADRAQPSTVSWLTISDKPDKERHMHQFCAIMVGIVLLAARASAGARGKVMAVAESSDVDPNKNWQKRPSSLSPEAIQALAKTYSNRGVAAFGLYESTIHTWSRDARRAIHAAGWNYNAQGK